MDGMNHHRDFRSAPAGPTRDRAAKIVGAAMTVAFFVAMIGLSMLVNHLGWTLPEVDLIGF